ncbi:MAG: dethiobiotin synthase [Idiomarina sp.]|nr:dethiobiotin synthase [Idiomarina sp.]
MSKCFFVTGTDTEVGKTKVSTLLMQSLASRASVTGFKPVAAGCELIEGRLQNEDALALMKASNLAMDYEQVNPIALQPPIAPHIAAAEARIKLSIQQLSELWANYPKSADYCLIEGAGGWCLPLNDREWMSDWVVQESFPVLLVVGMRLGCLNHALLTYRELKRAKVQVVGWVANQCQPEPMSRYQENLEYLKAQLAAPLIAEVPFFAQPHDEERWLRDTGFGPLAF